MYPEVNFQTKKTLRDAIENGEEVRLWSPGEVPPQTDGTEEVERPHFPEAPCWSARVVVSGGRVTKVLSALVGLGLVGALAGTASAHPARASTGATKRVTWPARTGERAA
jgi:hypothetical protein